MLPPLATWSETAVRDFDSHLTNAVRDTQLPDGWRLVAKDVEDGSELI